MKINFLPETSGSKNPNTNKAYNALNTTQPIIQNSLARQNSNFSLTKLIIILAVAFLIIFAALAAVLAFSKNQMFDNLSKLNLFGQVGQLMTSQDKKLVGEDEDRVNILLMGVGGDNHDGGKLTDTMILMSFKPSTNQVAMMSVPRDLYVKADGYGWTKINAINAYAEQKKAGSGGQTVTDAVSKLLDQKIPYYVVVDFDGFEKLIDQFGGVDVVVDNNLVDYQYPIRGREDAYPISSRFEKLDIKKGPQHFDGATALKYARSRHALGGEGSDFARSKRQQKIIIALKDKILSSQTLMSPGKISNLLSAYNKNVKTNFQLWELLRIYNLSKNVDTTQIIHQPLDDSGAGMLYSQMLNGAYVLLPTGGNYARIKAVWQNIFISTSTNFTINTTNEDAGITKEIEQLNAQSKKESFTVISSTPKTTPTTSPAVATSSPNTPVDQIKDSANTDSASTVDSDKPAYQLEGAKIEIRNGTQIAGWATSEKTKLLAQKLTVSQTGNAPTRDYKNIYIYDLSRGKYPATSQQLSDTYGVNVSNSKPPFTSNANFLIILGK